MAVTTIAAIGLAVAASSTGYQISENEAAKDQAKKQRAKQEKDALAAQADLEAQKQKDINDKVVVAQNAAMKANRIPKYNSSGFANVDTAQKDPLSTVIGQTSANAGQRTLIGG